MPWSLPLSNFIHVPKTGGMWVIKNLTCLGLHGNPTGSDHGNYKELTNNKSSFAFVRNPVTWYQSRWSEGLNLPGEPVRWFNSYKTTKTLDETFGCWLSRVANEPNVTNMYKHLLGNNFNQVTHIGKYEKLEEDLIIILNTIGEKICPCRIDRTPLNIAQTGCRGYPSKSHIKRIIDLEYEVMEHFHYPTDVEYYDNLTAILLL